MGGAEHTRRDRVRDADPSGWARRLAGLDPAIAASGAIGLRTSKRTNNYMAPETSAQLGQRLPDELLAEVEASAPHTCVRGPEVSHSESVRCFA